MPSPNPGMKLSIQARRTLVRSTAQSRVHQAYGTLEYAMPSPHPDMTFFMQAIRTLRTK